MKRASNAQSFERASCLRDQVHALDRIFAHRTAIRKEYGIENQKALHELRLLLKLPHTPHRIEGYDISNIQGMLPVGSMVVFTDGMSDKNEYRRFKIRTIHGANDPAMLREVLTRRLKRTDWPLPQIMLIDGGRPQLSAALATQRSSSRPEVKRIVVIAMAKREEELYLPAQHTPLKLKEMPTALLYLLQQIRNEAHRFAITFYRKRHRKSIAPLH